MEFSGIIHKICETVHVNATFKKRAFIIESSETKESGTYTELAQFEFIQDKCDKLDGVKVGDQVNVGFNLKGRKWTRPQGEDKFFNTLQAWMIKLLECGELPKPQMPQAAPAPTPPAMGENTNPEEEVPF